MSSISKENVQPSLVRFDWAIKNIFRQKANFEVLEGFLSELLNEDLKVTAILESESNQETADEKIQQSGFIGRI